MSKTKQSEFPTISLNGYVIFVIKLNGKTEYMLAKTARSTSGQSFKNRNALLNYLEKINENLKNQAQKELQIFEEAQAVRRNSHRMRPGLITSILPF